MAISVRIPWAVWALAIFNVVLHLAFYQHLEYHRDELLYFSLGGHPAAGYASVPPLIGWVAWLVRSLAGTSVLAVKLVPALASGGLVLVGAAISRQLGGGTYAQILAGVGLIVMPLTLRAFFLFQPVFLDIFIWTLTLYWFILFLTTSSDRYLYALGITLGAGLLNKYLIVILAGCLVLSLLLTDRSVFKKKSLYLAALAGLVVFLPNLIWQIAHDFPVIQHMQVLGERQLVHVGRADFLKDQVLMTVTVTLLVWPGLVYLFLSKKYRSVALTITLVIVALCLLRGKNYYTAGIYPTLVAAGGVAWERWIARKGVRIALPMLLVVLTLPILPLGLPVYDVQGLIAYFQRLDQDYGMDEGRYFEDGTVHSLPQDYADMLGWEELTQLVSKAYRQTGDKRKVVIYCENYGQAGAVAVIGPKYGLPEPMSFNESFLYWAPSHLKQDVQEFIYVNDELDDDMSTYFADIREVGRIQNVHAREYGTRVYLCRQPKADFRATLEKIMQRMTPFGTYKSE